MVRGVSWPPVVVGGRTARRKSHQVHRIMGYESVLCGCVSAAGEARSGFEEFALDGAAR